MFSYGNFSTGQNELIGDEDNIENDDTIEPGSGEINIDECDDEQSLSTEFVTVSEPNEALPIPVSFAHNTIEADVSTFTGIDESEMFKAIFEMVKPKAQVMKYWNRQKKTSRLHKRANLTQLTHTVVIP